MKITCPYCGQVHHVESIKVAARILEFCASIFGLNLKDKPELIDGVPESWLRKQQARPSYTY
jgi:hypothetical protein